ncbi:MAG: Cytosine-specific methyltransferase [Candidatus Nomurabacteria bacterium GW2011_GWB1_37_5]|uniref:Cytosine-specific methyltransferase n=1 Tax=Candidatus Nomurabacteria bacterium GW2011_GWB1_37_5 TaxID=1618742 RepID=A0A0G0JGF1_9BACT|nr:MAG: Cytosine-specific methyltransferase [Candidatus Nomurabacteria bacterium GW2011_GWB1_37_5]
MNKKTDKTKNVKFIDLFAGIGGFHLAFHKTDARCVFISEWDEHARMTYERNFVKIEPELFKQGLFATGNNLFAGDITKINAKDIPDFDVLCGGFPCQPFSQAGFKKGFSDTRGTLFHDIIRIIKEKKPAAFFLENVRHLLNHDNGKTFEVIKKAITDELGYSFYYKIVKASDYGLPQHRPRLFMVGFKNHQIKFEFPEPIKLKKTMSDIMGGHCNRKIGYTLRVGGRGSGLNDRRNWDTYLVNGKIKRLTSSEGKKLMGFPNNFEFPVTETQAMKQLGNAVAVDAIYMVAQKIIDSLKSYD